LRQPLTYARQTGVSKGSRRFVELEHGVSLFDTTGFFAGFATFPSSSSPDGRELHSALVSYYSSAGHSPLYHFITS
jgi:hypothetical protein